jgi:MoaA/NifB/PqqE/SkfB family radical SAM enzyme
MNPLLRKSINIDITHKCTLECSTCLRRSVDVSKLKEITIKDFEKVIAFYDQIEFCGQVSDPIFHSKFITMLELTQDKRVFVKTSASHRKMDWYIRAFNANKAAIWEFGVDGLPEDSHKYRVKQDGKHLFNVMKKGIELGNDIRWQYIIFKYNEANIPQALEISKKEGIPIQLVKSSRWRGDLDPLRPSEANCA